MLNECAGICGSSLCDDSTQVSFTGPAASSAGSGIGSWEQIDGDNREGRAEHKSSVIVGKKVLRGIEGDVGLWPNGQDESALDH